jgi:predicted acetyltransferase
LKNGNVIDANVISLEVASPGDADELSELLEHYVGELSTLFAIEADADGRFRYGQLPLYWAQPDRRFAFFIRSGQDRVGVALTTRESATGDAPEHFDVAEFFVLPAHRGRGVGRQAASLLWDRLPGQWAVRVSEANGAALPFWRNTIRSYTGGTFSVSERPGRSGRWQVFSFRSTGAPAIEQSSQETG